jgi:hypothetical protein
MNTFSIILIAALLVLNIIRACIIFAKENDEFSHFIVFLIAIGVNIYALYSFLTYFVTIKTP